MDERKFQLTDPSLISCNMPCEEQASREVPGDIVKQAPNQSTTKRCIAAGSPLRGQHYGLKSEAEHLARLKACRVCTVYTQIDNSTSLA